MGCDIHGFIEIMFEGKWTYAGRLEGDRNYTWFAVVADVRRAGIAGDQDWHDRGLPEDLTPYVDRCYGNREHTDWHSATYLSLEELGECWKLYAEIREKESIEEGDSQLKHTLQDAEKGYVHPVQRMRDSRWQTDREELPDYNNMVTQLGYLFAFNKEAKFTTDYDERLMTDVRIIIWFDN